MEKESWDSLIQALIEENRSWSTEGAQDNLSFFIGNFNVTLKRNGTWSAE